MMGKIVLVGLGGFFGAVLRCLIGAWVQAWSGSESFLLERSLST